jgi:hypothetical protein
VVFSMTASLKHLWPLKIISLPTFLKEQSTGFIIQLCYCFIPVIYFALICIIKTVGKIITQE